MSGLTHKIQPDRSKINLHDRKELDYWLRHFHVSQQDLQKGRGQSRKFGGRRPQGAGSLAERARYTRDLLERGPRAALALNGSLNFLIGRAVRASRLREDFKMAHSFRPVPGFGPSEPAILHDRLTNTTQTWTGDDAERL
jgi:Protein of unknown function (DUF3606)